MPTSFGVTSAGFVKKRLSDVQSDIQSSLLSSLGPSVNLLPSAVMGQLVSIFSEREALIWELAEAVYNAQYPDTATGVSLDNAVALTGIRRLPATFSTVTATVTGTAGTVIPTTITFAVAGTGAGFKPIAPVTIPAGGSVSVPLQAVNTGPVPAPSGTLTVIQNPQAGVSSVTNPIDAVLGSFVETDSALQLRRLQSLQIAGTGTVEAIRAKLLNLTGVTTAKVIENAQSVADSSGRPPNSYECLIVGGDDTAIRNMIWNSKPAAIQTYGTTTGTVTDSQGFIHPVNFSRPAAVPIYVVANIHTNSSYPVDGDTQVANALLAAGLTLGVNQNVLQWLLISALDDIPGIETVDIRLGTAASPTATTNIAIGVTQVANFQSSRITLVHV